MLDTSLEFIIQEEKLLINSYYNRYSAATANSPTNHTSNTKAPDHNQDELSIKLEQTKALEALLKSKIEMKSIQESIKEARKIGVIGGVESLSAGEVVLV